LILVLTLCIEGPRTFPSFFFNCDRKLLMIGWLCVWDVTGREALYQIFFPSGQHTFLFPNPPFSVESKDGLKYGL